MQTQFVKYQGNFATEGIPSNNKTVFNELPFHCGTTYKDNFAFSPNDPDSPYKQTRKPILPPNNKQC